MRAVAAVMISSLARSGAAAADRSKLESDANAALTALVSNNAGAKAISAKAHAVLVLPSITKAGLMIGGQSGDGVSMKAGRTVAYYNTSGASYGLQAGCRDTATRCSS
jgi:lipid-binding SYLF domain-containing protein